jgi:hypothetical protein
MRLHACMHVYPCGAVRATVLLLLLLLLLLLACADIA